MITVYDLNSFSIIDTDDSAFPHGMPELAPATELRLQPVAESAFPQATSTRDYSGVIAAQALAKLSP